MSNFRFAALVALALLALAQAELWRRRPVYVADSAGGAYLWSARAGRALYCERGACRPVGRAER